MADRLSAAWVSVRFVSVPLSYSFVAWVYVSMIPSNSARYELDSEGSMSMCVENMYLREQDVCMTAAALDDRPGSTDPSLEDHPAGAFARTWRGGRF